MKWADIPSLEEMMMTWAEMMAKEYECGHTRAQHMYSAELVEGSESIITDECKKYDPMFRTLNECSECGMVGQHKMDCSHNRDKGLTLRT